MTAHIFNKPVVIKLHDIDLTPIYLVGVAQLAHCDKIAVLDNRSHRVTADTHNSAVGTDIGQINPPHDVFTGKQIVATRRSASCGIHIIYWCTHWSSVISRTHQRQTTLASIKVHRRFAKGQIRSLKQPFFGNAQIDHQTVQERVA